jgi:hypothetical protein
MPRIPTDYSKALIYKIVCNDIKIKECYYGSTTNFKARKFQHKSNCKNINSTCYNNTKYQFIRCNGGWDNWNMVLVKEFACNNKLELEREERRCMEQDENRLNDKLPARTSDEKKQYEKKYHKEYHKEHYKENKEEILKKNKTYREKNPDYIKKYREENKEVIIEQNKKYREENPEKIKKYRETYREENKAKLNKKYDCKCGGKYTHKNKSQHLKTDKHQEYIKSN